MSDAAPLLIGEFDRQVFADGHHWHVWSFLGANRRSHAGRDGVLFATWAPNARRVSVVGDFNGWDGSRHRMRPHPGGIWEAFVPDLADGALYKFELEGAAGGAPFLKADPYARAFQRPPLTASIVSTASRHAWADGDWMARRARHDWLHAPMSAYEVHLGSWRHGANGEALTYRELAQQLVPYVRDLGYTHLELLPVSEHPYGPSWGYQTLGNYAPTARFGTPDDFRAFVDHCHQHGLGVILDWVPAHFPRDAHGLARFDGAPLYEYADRRGEHPDWSTLIYDYGRPEVRNYLLGSALHWLSEFHVDGLRVDAVASMLYLDYSRKPGEWLPNRHGGRENLEAIDCLRELNAVVHERHPGAVVIAEESTAWPQVTRPVHVGGLGFSMKWNMGWMHDTLDYLKLDPVHRAFHHERLTFLQLYAHSENFVLALSHDEVVHGKGSLLRKMAGDDWQRFASLRLLYAYQWTLPGKKLLFMGQEFAQEREWNDAAALDWDLLREPRHAGVQALLRDLNRLYAATPALHRDEFEPAGFEWIDCHDAPHSVISYLRRAGDDFVVVVLNFTPVPRHGYRIGVPRPGRYVEVLNSDSRHYGGSDLGNGGGAVAAEAPWMGRPCSLSLTLPPLAALVLALDSRPSPSATDPKL